MDESKIALGESKIAKVQAWYEGAIVEMQEARLGNQLDNAEILAAMVAKYPPDWSQAVSIDADSGITRVTTVLGPEQPATTHSHAALAAVRTISVDLNQDDEVVGSRLLEFVSSDSLDPGNFFDYVQQWGDRDFGDIPMLTSEYDIAYDAKICELYTPGEGFEPVDLTLEEVSGTGKTQVSTVCWITNVEQAWICVGGGGSFPNEVCGLDSVSVEITCVTYGGGGGGGGGGSGDGGDDGSDDDDDEEEEEEEDCVDDDEDEEEDEEDDCDEEEDEEEEEEEEEEECDDMCTKEQCDLEKEYDDSVFDDSALWPCTKFHEVLPPRFYSGVNGTHGGMDGEHKGWGYTNEDMRFGYNVVEAHFPEHHVSPAGFNITSVWRCPVGNSQVGGAPGSYHKKGLAIDFTGVDDGVPWPYGETDTKETIYKWARHPNRGPAQAGFHQVYDTKSHLHLDWRNND